MSIQVENNLKNTENKQVFEQRAHFVPCKIGEDGVANVNKYFEPYVFDENGVLSATFRGHSLDGTKLSLPEGYTAVVITEAKRPLAENADRRFQVAGGFKDLVYWNWDKRPSKNDDLVKALDWVDIAEAVAGGFKDLVYCNWDKRPSKNDDLVKALDWVDIAEAVVGGFKILVYWNWDKRPSKNDDLVKALDFVDIPEDIHGD